MDNLTFGTLTLVGLVLRVVLRSLEKWFRYDRGHLFLSLVMATTLSLFENLLAVGLALCLSIWSGT